MRDQRNGGVLAALLALAAGCTVVGDEGDPSSGTGDTALASCGSELAVSAVSASGDDGNVPINVLDNNTATRWSCDGVGCWIKLDLGKTMNVCSLSLAWYRGTIRASQFQVFASAEGVETKVFDGQSSGQSAELETVDIADTQARYVRIVVNGNTQNTWASITEAKVFGSEISTIAPALDQFGITRMFPSVGREWFSKWTSSPRSVLDGDPLDPEFKPSGDKTRMLVSGDAQGTLEVRGEWPRFNITDPAKIKTWRNVEVTYYFKVVSEVQGSLDYGIAAESRDGDLGPFPDNTGLGYSYNTAMRYRGRVFVQKEVTDHCAYTGGAQTVYPWSTPDKSMPLGQWIGVKYIVRNVDANTHVSMMTFVDLTDGHNGGDWKKLVDYTDAGNWWASLSMNCSTTNLAPSRPLNWLITGATNNIRFRADFADPVMYKKVSIREVAPLP